jgi:acyl-CoA synthetase (AMP-forming)/AMP-acid ligase II
MRPLAPTSLDFLRLQSRRDVGGGVFFAGRRIAYGELAAAAEALAAWLARRGVGPGQHVAVIAANEPAFVAVLYALWGLGAVVVPVGVRATAAEAARLVAHARASGSSRTSRAPTSRARRRRGRRPAWACAADLPLAPHVLGAARAPARASALADRPRRERPARRRRHADARTSSGRRSRARRRARRRRRLGRRLSQL